MDFTGFLASLNDKFKLQLIDMDMNNTTPIEVRVDHKYKDEMIVPYCAIDNNIAFLLCRGERYVDTKDGAKAKVLSAEERNICDLEQDIQRLYNKDAWSFVKIWHKYNPNTSSLFFVHLKLQKVEAV